MKRTTALLLLAALAAGCARRTVTIDLDDVFGDARGCFVLRDVEGGVDYVYHPERLVERRSPCSTFKVPHALIALDLGVLEGPDTLLPWDGEVRLRPELNRDHDLRSAVRYSVVWYFQEVARRIGAERMQAALDGFDYGNRDISGGQDRFWLGSTLALSPLEQVAWLDRLRRGDLPASAEALAATRELIVLERDGARVLRGKTGSHAEGEWVVLGWFVGWLECEGRAYVFATRLDDSGPGSRARGITLRVLERFQGGDFGPSGVCLPARTQAGRAP